MTVPIGSRAPRRKIKSADLRKAAWFIAVCFACAFLVVDHAYAPSDDLQVGDVAEGTIKAPFSFHYEDITEFERERQAAREGALPVYVIDQRLTNELKARIALAFGNARMALTPEVPEAPTEPGEGDESGDTVEPSDEDIAKAMEHFLVDLSVHIPDEDVALLVRAGFNATTEQLTSNLLSRAMQDKFVLASRDMLPSDRRPLLFQPLEGEAYRFTDYESLISPADAGDLVMLGVLESQYKAPWVDACVTVARALIRPNIRYDAERTRSYRATAEASIPAAVKTVKRGTTLFRDGQELTEQHLAMYHALQNSRTERTVFVQATTIALFLMLICGGLFGFGAGHLRGFSTDIRSTVAAGALLILVGLLGRLTVASSEGIAQLIGNEVQPESIWFLTPMAGAVVLLRLLVGIEWAVLFTVAGATVCGLLMEMDAVYLLYFAVTGLIAAGAVEHTRERMAVIRAGLYTGVFGALVVLVIHFLQVFVIDAELSMATTIRPFWSMSFAFGGGVVSSFLVLGLMPVFESAGFVTDYRLQELASLNHPLLRQLMLRAPGTYHHSVIVGTLAEAGCEEVGANSLQAKIAAYFHDIGKMEKPQYFVENQRGMANRHNVLDPSVSAQIIIDHVIAGARMAREHKLPRPIIDNIYMHHGTGLLSYFYSKASQDAEDPDMIDEANFRYPGPKPTTREAGIIMLADKVEAATRTIKSPSEESIRLMIERIIRSVMVDGQFTECPLTFREISTVAEVFVQVLLGIYHQRIEYAETRDVSSAGAEPEEPELAQDWPESTAEGPNSRAIALDFALSKGVTDGSLQSLGEELDDEDTDYESVGNLPGTRGR